MSRLKAACCSSALEVWACSTTDQPQAWNWRAMAAPIRRGRPLLWVGAGLVLMGVGIEFAQGALTSNRMADPMDAVANTVGVLAGMATALTPLRDMLLRWRG